MHTEKLLTIDETFEIENRGVVVMPTIPQEALGLSPTRMVVLLRKPDGTEARTPADFTVPMIPHPNVLRFACVLRQVRKEDIPIGTEVHRLIEDESSQSSQPTPSTPCG